MGSYCGTAMSRGDSGSGGEHGMPLALAIAPDGTYAPFRRLMSRHAPKRAHEMVRVAVLSPTFNIANVPPECDLLDYVVQKLVANLVVDILSAAAGAHASELGHASTSPKRPTRRRLQSPSETKPSVSHEDRTVALMEKAATVLETRTGGIRARELRVELGLRDSSFKRLINTMIDGGMAVRLGKKGGTVYFPPTGELPRARTVALMEKAAAVLATRPKGIRTSELRAELALYGTMFKQFMNTMIESGMAVRLGERRGTTYFPPTSALPHAGHPEDATELSRMLELLRVHSEGMTSHVLGDALGISAQACRVWLGRAIHEGSVRREGTTKGTRYFAVVPFEVPVAKNAVLGTGTQD